jgi:hypothetical protein
MIACISCRFCNTDGALCHHATVMNPDPVRGWVSVDCREARAEGGKCGPDARFFVTRRASVASALGRLMTYALSRPHGETP